MDRVFGPVKFVLSVIHVTKEHTTWVEILRAMEMEIISPVKSLSPRYCPQSPIYHSDPLPGLMRLGNNQFMIKVFMNVLNIVFLFSSPIALSLTPLSPVKSILLLYLSWCDCTILLSGDAASHMETSIHLRHKNWISRAPLPIFLHIRSTHTWLLVLGYQYLPIGNLQ